MHKVLVFIFTVFGSMLVNAQADSVLVRQELALESLLFNLRSAENDAAKAEANQAFKEALLESIQHPNAMFYPYSRLKTLGSVRSSDNLVRLFNWNVEQDDFSQTYFCFVLHYDKRKKEYFVNELIDNSMLLPPSPEEVLDKNSWYGALYYQIVPFDKGSKTMYALLGWDGYTTSTTRKLIDVLYFSGTNPKLGSPVFRDGKETKKRVFFEHSEKTSMSLRYDEDNQRILFDHLSPESPNLKGFYAYYVPDMSYDAFRLKNGRWYLEEDVIAVNKRRPEKIEVQYPDDKNGKIRTTKLKNTWQDPSDGNAPNASTPHIARKPGEESDEQKKDVKKQKKSRKQRVKDKRDPSNLYPYNDLKRPKRRKRKRN